MSGEATCVGVVSSEHASDSGPRNIERGSDSAMQGDRSLQLTGAMWSEADVPS